MARQGMDVIDYEELLKDIERMKEDIEKLKKNQPNFPDYVPPYTPIVELCTDGEPHDYPFPWHSVEPAHCKKCGKRGESFKITF